LPAVRSINAFEFPNVWRVEADGLVAALAADEEEVPSSHARQRQSGRSLSLLAL
jgi:hypothetical protein